MTPAGLCLACASVVFFFFNDTATTEIYTLSLHDALPICWLSAAWAIACAPPAPAVRWRSEEHTSELQSRLHLVCRLLLEKKKKSGIYPGSQNTIAAVPPARTTHVQH